MPSRFLERLSILVRNLAREIVASVRRGEAEPGSALINDFLGQPGRPRVLLVHLREGMFKVIYDGRRVDLFVYAESMDRVDLPILLAAEHGDEEAAETTMGLDMLFHQHQSGN